MADNKVIIEITDRGSNKKYAKDTLASDKATNKLVGSAKKLVTGLIAIQTARKAIEFAGLAARAKDVELAFNNLADSAEIDADRMLESMKRATAGTISEFELMQQFSTASLLGLPLDRFDEMLAIARGASKATGQSMEFMLNSIVTALGRGSKLMLDNLGILIDVKSANERYAESLGKTSASLNDAERKQAFINDALRIGAGNLERIGDLGNSAADDFAKLAADMENLKVTLGDALLPLLTEVVPVLTNMAVALKAILAVTEESNPIIDEYTERYARYVRLLVDGRITTDQYTAAVDRLNEARLRAQALVAANTPIIDRQTQAFDLQKIRVKELTTNYKPLARNVQDTAAIMQKQRDAALASLNAIASLSRLMGGDANSDMQKFLGTAIDVLNILTSIKAIKSVTSTGGFFAGIGSLLGFAGGGITPGGPVEVNEGVGKTREIIAPPAGTRVFNPAQSKEMNDRPQVIQVMIDDVLLGEVLVRQSGLGHNQLATQPQ